MTYTPYQRVSDVCFAPNLYQNDIAQTLTAAYSSVATDIAGWFVHCQVTPDLMYKDKGWVGGGRNEVT